jgi:hypothetical protein
MHHSASEDARLSILAATHLQKNISIINICKPILQKSACIVEGHEKNLEAVEGPRNKHGNCEEQNYAHVKVTKLTLNLKNLEPHGTC